RGSSSSCGGWPGRYPGCDLRRTRCIGRQDEEYRALTHAIAKLDLQLLNNAAERRRNLHRGLVGFESDKWLLRLDRVARLHHDLNDRHFLKLSDVGHSNFGNTGRRAG